MAQVHPSAVLDKGVQLADDVVVGPGCALRGDVTVAAGCELVGMVWIEGRVTIGPGNRFFPNVVIGAPAQDFRCDPSEPTEMVIGANNIFREHVTVHRGTRAGGGVTRIGDGCMFMVASHVGHDSTLQDKIVLINNVTVGGHCRVETGAWLSGHSAMVRPCLSRSISA